QFSLLESTIRIDPLMARLKELQMPAAALTDKGNLFGAISFYQSALSHGLKPILGCEIWVSAGARFEKNHSSNRPEAVYPLVLLAENEEGYKNLVKLSSAGYLRGDFQVPHVDKDLLSRHSKGLIALSGGSESEIDKFILKDESPLALKAAGEYQEMFGPDRYYLEIQDHRKPSDKNVQKKIAEISRQTSVPMVATNSAHYLRREEALFHEVLLCLGRGEVLSNPDHSTYGTDEYYLKSAEEMSHLFGEVPESLQRTLEIAERCHVHFDFGKTLMPSFTVPVASLDEPSFLEKLCLEGVVK